MIYSLQLYTPNYFEAALVRDVGVDPATIVKVPDSSYVSRIPPSGTLIAPGGETHFLAKLHSVERIHELVKDGLNYWGICAGGNLGAFAYLYDNKRLKILMNVSDTTFTTSHGSEREKLRTLYLLPVIAEGPNLPVLSNYGSITPVKTKNQSLMVYWNKGSHFMRDNALTENRAYYEDGKIAAVYGQCASGGNVLLFGCHPELSYADLEQAFPNTWNESNPDYHRLKEDDSKRASWMRSLATSVKIHPKK